MKTIEIQLFKFSELSEDAQKKAIDHFRESDNDFWFIEEANETFKKFADLFSIKWREIDYEQPYRNNYSINLSDDIKGLSGIRLMKYIWNNYKNDLFKGKYYSVKSDFFIVFQTQA